MNKIIPLDKSIIPACDVENLELLGKMAEAGASFPQVVAYKVGFDLGLGYGLPKVVAAIREHDPNAVVIYDHQKAATDIPKTGKNFARRMKSSGIDAAILFPEAGPVTEEAWIKALQDEGVGVFVGGEMTHKGYLETEGGYIRESAPEEMYTRAALMGVDHFIVPGNRLERIALYKGLIEELGVSPVFAAPGFVDQKGNIKDAAKVAGSKWHAICGTAVYNPNKPKPVEEETVEDMKASIATLVKDL